MALRTGFAASSRHILRCTGSHTGKGRILASAATVSVDDTIYTRPSNALYLLLRTSFRQQHTKDSHAAFHSSGSDMEGGDLDDLCSKHMELPADEFARGVASFIRLPWGIQASWRRSLPQNLNSSTSVTMIAARPCTLPHPRVISAYASSWSIGAPVSTEAIVGGILPWMMRIVTDIRRSWTIYARAAQPLDLRPRPITSSRPLRREILKKSEL